MEKGNLARKYEGVFLTIQEVSRELRLTKNDIVSLVENNQLRAELIANKYRFRVLDVEEFVFGEKTGENQENAVSSYKQTANTYEKVGGKKMTGSITKTGDRFIVQFSLGKGPDGKRIRESKTFKSLEMAELYRENRAAELNRGITNKEFGEYTFKEYSAYYLKLNKNGAKSRTIAGYSNEVKAVNEIIGNIKIKELTESDILTAFQNLSLSYKENVLKKKWTVTRMILKFATISEHISKNPTELIKRPKSEVYDISDYDSKAYSDREQEAIFVVAKLNIEIYTMLRVLQATGMRPGELRALRWKDLEDNNRIVSIKSAATRKYEKGQDILNIKKYREIISYTKSNYSVRTLTLSNEASEALSKWRDYLDTYENETKKSSIYIFPGPDGEFMKEKTFSNKIYKFFKKQGLGDIKVTPYRFRHTLCTNLIRIGTPEQVVLEILGDNSRKLINEVYSHITKKDTTEYSNKLFNENKNY